MLKFTQDARNRIQDGLKKYGRIVAQARHRGTNERDTSDIVKAMLGDMLGFDPFFEVTADSSVRGPHADYAILLDGRLQLLLMVKPLGVLPNAAHLLRLSGASTPQYVQWTVLTNADTWSVYRLGVGPDRHAELIFRLSLQEQRPVEEKIAQFFLISKEGLQQNALELYWEQMGVLHPGRIVSLLLTEDVLSILRREIQRTSNYRVDRAALYDALIQKVIRPDALAARTGEPPGARPLPHCFAYVRDPNDAGTWRLRYRNADGTPNADLLTVAVVDLGADAAALGIPPDDVALVKARVRQAYYELGVLDVDLPAVLR